MAREVTIDYRALREAGAAYDRMVTPARTDAEARRTGRKVLRPPARTLDADTPQRSSYHALLEDIRKGAY